jgi:hypothetical protein
MSTVLYINHFPLFGLGNYTCMFMKKSLVFGENDYLEIYKSRKVKIIDVYKSRKLKENRLELQQATA